MLFCELSIALVRWVGSHVAAHGMGLRYTTSAHAVGTKVNMFGIQQTKRTLGVSMVA